jgi:hypothetical protein
MRHVPTCQAAWQELEVPAELRPFYPEGGAWQSGRLVVLGLSAESPYESRERGLVYDPRAGFSVVSEAGMPNIQMLAAAVAASDGVAFMSIVDANGTYDAVAEQWREVPDPGRNVHVQTVGSSGTELAISYDQLVESDDLGMGRRETGFSTHTPGDEIWRETSEPPFPDWNGPALAWTDHELLAWGGATYAGGGDREPTNAAARYDPALDAWSSMSLQGAPTEPGGGMVWTDPEAVAWGSGRYEVASGGGRYDPALDRWRPVATPPPGAGFGAPVVVVGGRVVSWTGSTEGSTSRVATYDPRDDSWVDAPTRCGPLPRRDPVFAWVDDGIVVWGGSVWPAGCDASSDPLVCHDSELQRAFYLPARALFGQVHDTGECACPEAR